MLSSPQWPRYVKSCVRSTRASAARSIGSRNTRCSSYFDMDEIVWSAGLATPHAQDSTIHWMNGLGRKFYYVNISHLIDRFICRGAQSIYRLLCCGVEIDKHCARQV